MLWDILILLTIVSFFFIITWQVSFGLNYEEEWHHFLEHYYHLHPSLIEFIIFLPEMMLIFDTLLKFITGYYENGIVITDKKEIIHHYLKKGLLFDIISYCPILMQTIFKGSFTLKILQLLLFCKLKRVQIIMNNFKEIISLKGKNDFILSLIILLFQIFFFCHIIACIWHSVAFYYPLQDSTWLDYAHIRNLPWSSKYFYSLYWSVSSMVTCGFGEKVSPQNNSELVVGVMILLCSAIFLGFMINSMREIIDEMGKHKKKYKFIFDFFFIYLIKIC